MLYVASITAFAVAVTCAFFVATGCHLTAEAARKLGNRHKQTRGLGSATGVFLLFVVAAFTAGCVLSYLGML